ITRVLPKVLLCLFMLEAVHRRSNSLKTFHLQFRLRSFQTHGRRGSVHPGLNQKNGARRSPSKSSSKRAVERFITPGLQTEILPRRFSLPRRTATRAKLKRTVLNQKLATNWQRIWASAVGKPVESPSKEQGTKERHIPGKLVELSG